MSDIGRSHAARPVPPKEDPERLVLRGRPRAVVRFRRGVVIGITGVAAASVIAVTWLALEPPAFRMAAEQERAGPLRDPAPEALAGAPASYGDVPRLGPPLPGDLGRPILEQQRRLEEGSATGETAASEAERARAAAEAERQREAARSSGILVQLAARNAAPAPSGPREPVAAMPATTHDERRQPQDPAGSGTGGLNAENRGAPSPWTLSAGTIIPASLITGLNSDLPGIVIAQVTQAVRDSATGRTVLIPQGARLIGSYGNEVGFGQRRALLVWQRIVFPDGSSVRLDDMPAADASGYAGVEDKVDFHTWRLLQGIALSTLLGVGTELSLGSDERDLVRALRESAQQNAARAGDRITSRNLDIRPTLRVRPGWPVRAIVHKDLVLRPWRG